MKKITAFQLTPAGQSAIEKGIADKDALRTADEYLKSNTFLSYLRIRQKYLNLQTKDLVKLSGTIKKYKSLERLNILIDGIITEKENESVWNLKEDIFVNNLPTLWNLPFYESQRRDISLLSIRGFRLYFNNLKLSYKPQKLIKADVSLYVNETAVNNYAGIKTKIYYNNTPKFINRDIMGHVREGWSYDIVTRKTDFLYNNDGDREYTKKYQENPVSPKFFKGTLIFRNEDRLFCLDILTGEEIWSIALGTKKEELYQTTRHPHHNTSSLDFLIEDDRLFTVLGRKLAVINLKDVLKAEKLWEKDLGEYSAATTPVKYKDNLVIGLINATGELWVCGFDIYDGDLKWSTYIGISSCLSPSCSLFKVIDDKLIIGTNHKVILCIRPLDGSVFWIKKYTSRKYDLTEVWLKGHYLDRYFEDKYFIDFDTQFINNYVDEIYYKPRDSDYLYVLGLDGKPIDELLIDHAKYYLLVASKDKLVFLERKPEDQVAKLCVLSSDNKKIFDLDMKGGELKGLVRLNDDEMFFKIEKTVHFLNLSDKRSHCAIVTGDSGWMLNATDRMILTCDEGKLKCSLFSKKEAETNRDVNALIDLRRDIMDNLQKTVDLNIEPSESIIDKINKQTVSLKEMTVFFINNSDRLNKTSWKKICKKLSQVFTDEVITFKETEVYFSNFLIDLGFVESEIDKKDGYIQIKSSAQLTIEGGRIGLVPLKVIKGPKCPDIFIVQNSDQLTGVNNEGRILWERNAFCNLNFTDRRLESCLYGNIIILNDNINIIAVDKNNGRYLWSKTNNEIDKKPYFTNDFISKYELDFIDDRVIVLHNSCISSLNPNTGYTYNISNVGNIRMIKSDGKLLYTISYTDNNIVLRTMNKELEIIDEVKIDSSEMSGNKGRIELVSLDDYMVIYWNSKLYFVNKKTKNIKEEPFISSMVFFERFPGNTLFVFEPFRRLLRYDANLVPGVVWDCDFDKGKVILNDYLGNRPYYFEENRVLLPYYEKSKYYLMMINTETGKKTWKRILSHTSGNYIHFSDFIKIGADIYFMVSSGHDERVDQNKCIIYNIITRFYKINIDTGALKLVNEFPFVSNFSSKRRNVLLCTDKLIVATTNGSIIKILRK